MRSECSNEHDTVWYEGGSCPACELVDRITEVENTVDELKAKLDTIKDEAIY